MDYIMQDSPVSLLDPVRQLSSDDLFLVSKLNGGEDGVYTSNKISHADMTSAEIQCATTDLSGFFSERLSAIYTGDATVNLRTWD